MLGLDLSLTGLVSRGGARNDAGFSAEVQQAFNRMVTPPEGGLQTNIADLIDGLVAGNYWTKCDRLFSFAVPEAGNSLINLRAATLNAQQQLNAGVFPFTANRGWASGSFGSHLITNFNPTTDAGAYSLDDAAIGFWCLSAAPGTNQLVADDDNKTYFWGNGANQPINWGVNGDASGQDLDGTEDISGWWWLERTGHAAQAAYRNNVLKKSSTAAAAGMPNSSFNIPRGQFQVGMFIVGASSGGSSGVRTAIYDAATAFMTARLAI